MSVIGKGTIVADKYLIKELLGEGSSGAVFLAQSLMDGEMYTLKVSADKVLLKREAFLLGQLGNEYFPGFVDYAEAEEYGYLVLEYVEGISLQHLIDKGRRFSEEETLILMEAVTSALILLHQRKQPMVHLDIKPANIVINTKGRVRIIDMGAGSRVGELQMRKGGTYGYGAPEQFWQGTLPGPSADVYACGKLMAYLATGKNPGVPPYDVEERMLRSKGVRKSWQRVILKCLEKEPVRRYPDCGFLHREIMGLQKELQCCARGVGTGKEEVVYLKSIWRSDYERV